MKTYDMFREINGKRRILLAAYLEVNDVIDGLHTLRNYVQWEEFCVNKNTGEFFIVYRDSEGNSIRVYAEEI